MSELVSIVVPCYNSEKWVADAVRSALGQTHSEIEVIVIDDGSSDGSVNAVAAIDDERLKILTGPNLGACAARNRGAKEATGEYLQFLDSDDLLHPEKVATQLEILRHEDNALVFCQHDVISLDSGVESVQWQRKDDCSDSVSFLFRGDLSTIAPLHRRAAVLACGGWKEDQPCAQDREFHFRLALAGVRFLPIDDVLYTIRRRSGSVGSSNEANVYRARAEIAMAVKRKLEEAGRWNEDYQQECAAMLSRCGRDLYPTSPSEACELFDLAKSVHPSGGFGQAFSKKAGLLARLIGPGPTQWLAGRLKA